jgi:hypothetical protein
VQSSAAKPSQESSPQSKEGSLKKKNGNSMPSLEQWEEGESMFPVRHPGEFPVLGVF